MLWWSGCGVNRDCAWRPVWSARYSWPDASRLVRNTYNAVRVRLSRLFSALSAAAILAVAASAQDRPETREGDSRPESRPRTYADRVAEIDREYQAAQESWSKAYEEAKTPEEREKLPFPKPDAWHARLFAIAEEDRTGEGGEAALEWITSHSKRGADFGKALSLLASDHLASPSLKKACEWLEYSRAREVEAFLRKLASSSPHREVRGLATYTLAKFLKGDAESVGFAADALFVEVTEKYADVPRGVGRALGPRAEGFLFELRNLGTGKVAPEIEGEDVDGNPMKLSDFRGRVVVLDFWGFW
jgi:hypothetical protein